MFCLKRSQIDPTLLLFCSDKTTSDKRVVAYIQGIAIDESDLSDLQSDSNSYINGGVCC
jgi:hypothetical protein